MKHGEALNDTDIPESFGANVYDLLNNHFFMDQFIGDFAADTIDKMVRRVVNSAGCTQDEKKKLKKALSLIGDDFIRNTLIKKMKDYD